MNPNGPPHRNPAAAPTPPTETGTHATDTQGVRRYDTEDAAAHGLRPQQDRPNPTAPRPSLSIGTPRSSAVNSHRSVSASVPRYPIRYSSTNFFIPSFGMMYYILSAMTDKVCSHRDFSDNGPVQDWIPQASVLVYSILALIQVLRCQRLLGMTDTEQSIVLDQFLAHVPLENIVIPGPLVPFFRSLSNSNPGFGDYENVGPAIPSMAFAEERLYAIDYTIPGTNERFLGIDMMIPNIPLMLDQFRHLLTYLLGQNDDQAPNRYSGYTQLSTIFGMDTPAAGSPLLPRFQRVARSVGFWTRPTASNGLMSRFAQYYSGAVSFFPPALVFDQAHAPIAADPAAEPPVVARAANWDVQDSLIQALGFEQSYDWFFVLLRGMPTFTRHWQGNTRMSDISPISSTAAMIRFRDVEYTPTPRERLFGRAALNGSTHRLTFNSYATSACPLLNSEDFEDAQMVQVNITCANAFTGRRIGDFNVTHFGDFWNTPPDVVRTNQADLTQAYLALICSPDYYQA